MVLRVSSVTKLNVPSAAVLPLVELLERVVERERAALEDDRLAGQRHAAVRGQRAVDRVALAEVHAAVALVDMDGQLGRLGGRGEHEDEQWEEQTAQRSYRGYEGQVPG